jgi:peptide/nickel transport system substrate-binding protein
MANNWALSNWARYCNPAYDTLYEQVTKALNPDQRLRLFIELNDFLIEDVALIPLVHVALAAAINTDVQGLSITPWDADVWNIADWRMA